ncbi:hypothetical protein GPALN_013475 [Globodera pallida]|nr:hypothetical protein GPALN_013475 [Globodera pallida]
MSALDSHLFNLRFAAKELSRNAKKCDKQEKEEKVKLTNALKKGNREVAQVHAENSIRKKNEALNYLRMSARIDAVAARVQTAATQKRVTTSMQGVVKAMESAMKSMNLEKVQNLMDRCPIWNARAGFCQSQFYPDTFKADLCALTCSLCALRQQELQLGMNTGGARGPIELNCQQLLQGAGGGGNIGEMVPPQAVQQPPIDLAGGTAAPAPPPLPMPPMAQP